MKQWFVSLINFNHYNHLGQYGKFRRKQKKSGYICKISLQPFLISKKKIITWTELKQYENMIHISASAFIADSKNVHVLMYMLLFVFEENLFLKKIKKKIRHNKPFIHPYISFFNVDKNVI